MHCPIFSQECFQALSPAPSCDLQEPSVQHHFVKSLLPVTEHEHCGNCSVLTSDKMATHQFHLYFNIH